MATRYGFWQIAPIALMACGFGGFSPLESIRGDVAWSEYVLRAKVKGDRLSLAELLPAPVPDEENFGAAPVFKRRMAFLNERKLPPSEFSLAVDIGSALRTSDLERCSPTDWDRWSRHFRGLGWLDSDRHGPREILRVLDRFAKPLEELREAAGRPRSQFLVNWGDIDSRSVHFAPVNDASKLLALRVEAQMEQGTGKAVLDDLRLMFRLARAMEREPALLSGLTYTDIVRNGYNAVWIGLKNRSLGDAALEEIDALFASLDVPSHLRWMLESERALQNNVFDHAEKGSVDARVFVWWTIFETLPDRLALSLRAPKCLNEGRLDLNRHYDSLLARVDAKRRRNLPPTLHLSVEGSEWNVLRGLPENPWKGVTKSVVEKSWLVHTRVQQARIAVALERYHIKSGAYPETLSALVPAYLPVIPHDVCDGAPMRYRLDKARRYILYAIGMDMKDDGGAPPEPKSRKRGADWVWTYPSQ